MKISDLLRLSTENLRRRKGRTALTVIGVVVGTCAIVVMISLGIAMSKQTDAMLQSYGDLTQIQIYNYNSGSTTTALDDALIKQIKAMEHVVAATPYYQPNYLNGTITAGKNGRYTTGSWNITGIYPDAMEAMGFTLQSGSWLSDSTQLGGNKIPVLVGANFAYSFCDSRRNPNSPKYQRSSGQTDANGNILEPFVNVDKDKMTLTFNDADGKTAGTYQLVVVGVMTSDFGIGYFTDSGMVMRLTDLQKIEAAYKKANKIKDTTSTKNGYNQVNVKVDKVDNVQGVEDQIDAFGFETYSMSKVRKEMQASVAKSQMILGGLAAISLLVAALNIMNTMTMAIYERTREIGVMKVLGCELGQIRAMFLIESGAIGFIGGVLGVVFSEMISFALNHLAAIMSFFGRTVDLSWLSQMMGTWSDGSAGAISIVPLWLIVLALSFATLVGLLSGIAPAGRAVKISALEAIRHE